MNLPETDDWERWQCSDCSSRFNDPLDAYMCCAGSYECRSCKAYYDQIPDARDCCDGEPPRADARELERAGQERLFA